MEIIQKTEERMQKTIKVLMDDLGAINAGRVSPNMLKNIYVALPNNEKRGLNELGTIRVIDAKTLAISVWDSANAPIVEKAIRASQLGVSPVSAGNDVKIPFPDLSQERRKELAKMLSTYGNDAKNSLKAIRHDAMKEMQNEEKNRKVPEDEKRKFKENIQKVIDKNNAKVDELIKNKQDEIMKI